MYAIVGAGGRGKAQQHFLGQYPPSPYSSVIIVGSMGGVYSHGAQKNSQSRDSAIGTHTVSADEEGVLV